MTTSMLEDWVSSVIEHFRETLREFYISYGAETWLVY